MIETSQESCKLMDITSILESLNEEQRQAVSSNNLNTLVLAGAGCGKTRVIEHRAAWHIYVQGLMPSQIMAVTFTNKSAFELKARIEKKIRHKSSSLLAGTFHSISHQLLRTYHNYIGLDANFIILDSDDMLRHIKKAIIALNINQQQFDAKQIQQIISQAKENNVSPSNMPEYNNYQKQIKNIYTLYEKICVANSLLDFTDLLLLTIRLLKESLEARQIIHNRIQAILVDEFQDINALQYEWLQAFYHDKIYTLCVGDDDQSIYSWRGARADLMSHYAQNYPNVLTVRLEQNYRSTPTILEAANHVIANNQQRLGKNLWTSNSQGGAIEIFQAFTDLEEARYVLERIQDELQNGMLAKNIAILYRSNVQSRLLEEQCHLLGMPYRIYAGQRFFDRQEIKDCLAYFRVCINPDDTAALERIINTPNRGIGHVSLANLRNKATEHNMSLWQAINKQCQDNPEQKLSKTLQDFVADIKWMQNQLQNEDAATIAQHILDRSRLVEHIRRTEKEHESKCENLNELIEAIRQYCEDDNTFESFIQHVALMHSDDTQKDNNTISLMTLHAAKGLEFDMVFMVGVEEDLLPHKASIQDGLEEERRLCYVGMTRARKKLVITYCTSRRLYGQTTYQSPSRFIKEIPSACLMYLRGNIKQNKHYQEGQTVLHAKYGEGTIIKIEGANSNLRMLIDFESGCKWFLCEYAELQIIQ